MKYIKDFDSWLSENYPSFGETTQPSQEQIINPEDKELSTDISNLLFSFFDGGEEKFKTRLTEFNEKYKTDLKLPTDWTSLTILDEPERVYQDVHEFEESYRQSVK